MAEIEKIAVYDSRIIQDPPKYAVQKGALSVSTSTFQANAANASQLSFQILVPSLNVFTDRKIELNATAYCYAEAVPTQQISSFATSLAANNPFGVDIPGGKYIESPFTNSNEYNLQDPPIVATFPSNGTSWTQQGNSACVLPANSWPGLTESADEVQVAGNAQIPSPNAVGDGITLPLISNGLENPTAVTTAGLQIVNPFAKFAGSSVNVAGTFQINYRFLGTISGTGPLTASDGYTVLRCELFDPVGATVYGAFSVTCAMDIFNAGTVGVTAIGTSSLVINDALIASNVALKWRIYTTNAGLTPSTGNTLTLSACQLNMYGFNLAVVATPTYNNWYQSVGAPTDLSLGLFPVQSLATSMTATINDCSVSVSGDVLHEQLLLSQTRASLMQRTCPSKYDIYAWSADDARNDNGSTNAYDGARDSDIPNGSFPITFCHPKTGAKFNQFDAYQYTLQNGTTVTVPIINYRPAFIPYYSNLIGQYIPSSTIVEAGTGLKRWKILPTVCTNVLPLMFTFRSVEPLCLSPFLWQDAKQMSEVGLYGITNMTVNMTLTQPGPVLGYESGRSNNARGRLYMDKLNNAAGSYGYMTRQSGINALFGNMRLQPPTDNAGNQNGPWAETPRLLCTFLTPPPEIVLPLVSSVPYVEFPRYNSSASVTWGSTGTIQVTSNTVTLSSIPDLLVVFVRPAFRGQTQSDTYIPISNVGVTFDNYANLCSNYSQEDLYACSVAGGLDMDYNQFRGYTRGRFPTMIPLSSGTEGTFFDTFTSYSSETQLTGAPVVLRMGQDIPLSSGLAPGTLGNYSVQVSVTLDNTHGFFNYLAGLSSSNNVIITIMGVNSGFFESVRGSSAIRKTILNTNDVEAASTSSSITSAQLVRLVGGASGMHTSSRLTTSMGLPQFKPAMGEETRVRKMPRTSGMSGSMIP